MKKEKYKTMTIILFLLQNYISMAQINLVPNSSFELYDSCPNTVGLISDAMNWSGIGNQSVDYFNTCSSNSVGIPTNVIGYQMARTGNGYAGGVSFYPTQSVRDLIQVQLDSVLKPQHTYCAKFYVSLADSSLTACNNIGMYFSDTAINCSCGNLNNVIPQISNNILNNQLTNKILWTKVHGSYTALGGEKYITIGNFLNLANSDTTHVVGGNFGGAYYYIDDIDVHEYNPTSDSCCACNGNVGVGVNEAMNDELRVYPNPAKSTITLNYKSNTKQEITIENIVGEVVYTNSYKLSQPTIDISNLAKGIYFIVVQDDGSAGSPIGKVMRKKFVKE